MIKHFLISAAIYLFVCLPCILLSTVVVAILLPTKWDGKTTIFGNSKWGRGGTNPAYTVSDSYWDQWLWFVYRNPVNNLHTDFLATRVRYYGVVGDPTIGDKTRGGFYKIDTGRRWEYYYVKPYNLFGRRCIRIRFGWKINQNRGSCAFVFSILPFKQYLGV